MAGSPNLSGRIEFVILRTGCSPSVALHPVSRRRSYGRLQICNVSLEWTCTTLALYARRRTIPVFRGEKRTYSGKGARPRKYRNLVPEAMGRDCPRCKFLCLLSKVSALAALFCTPGQGITSRCYQVEGRGFKKGDLPVSLHFSFKSGIVLRISCRDWRASTWS
ncbi:MAG: hypothetical protein BWX80_02587 [Candidatus Hydrogenedentes bacterium ADurb.Bin101]|nr:MAG: hypothetical protein BWX80_02587 [Candidatus Hydrogenedentes bacterium ADurb.Bin101]